MYVLFCFFLFVFVFVLFCVCLFVLWPQIAIEPFVCHSVFNCLLFLFDDTHISLEDPKRTEHTFVIGAASNLRVRVKLV